MGFLLREIRLSRNRIILGLGSVLPVCCLAHLVDAQQPQPIIKEIRVVGADQVSESTIRGQLRSVVGQPFDAAVLAEDQSRLLASGRFADARAVADEWRHRLAEWESNPEQAGAAEEKERAQRAIESIGSNVTRAGNDGSIAALGSAR